MQGIVKKYESLLWYPLLTENNYMIQRPVITPFYLAWLHRAEDVGNYFLTVFESYYHMIKIKSENRYNIVPLTKANTEIYIHFIQNYWVGDA